jgi:DNA invertase Pin-like site-specific DNA recombinase
MSNKCSSHRISWFVLVSSIGADTLFLTKGENMSNIAYLRVSHTESLNGTSLEVQESKCRAFGELHGFTIDKVYTEVVSGGVEFRKRPIFQKVLSELKSGSKLVVSRLDRLSRKVVDTLKVS